MRKTSSCQSSRSCRGREARRPDQVVLGHRQAERDQSRQGDQDRDPDHVRREHDRVLAARFFAAPYSGPRRLPRRRSTHGRHPRSRAPCRPSPDADGKERVRSTCLHLPSDEGTSRCATSRTSTSARVPRSSSRSRARDARRPRSHVLVATRSRVPARRRTGPRGEAPFSTRPGKTFIAGLPMNVATKRLAGRR